MITQRLLIFLSLIALGLVTLGMVILGLAGCQAQPRPQPAFHATNNPVTLKAWGVIGVNNKQLVLGQDVVPYTLTSPLFTDYAHKLRTIWMPEAAKLGGGAQKENASGALNFPVGTVISKTFYYPVQSDGTALKHPDDQPVNATSGLSLKDHRLIETRLLVRRNAGWEPLSYIWNAEQTEAKLSRIGDIVRLNIKTEAPDPIAFAYTVPNINQCAGCHAPNNTTRAITPLGPKVRHLNRDYDYAEGPLNQLDKLAKLGFWTHGSGEVSEPAAAWDNPDKPLNARARAYLDINCAHCHNPVGPADTSGLHLGPDNQSLPHLGICKNAVAAGSGTGNRRYDIHPGRPDDSILLYRMEARDPGAMMPELGRSLVHSEGVALIRDWINNMGTGCIKGG